MIDPYLKEPSPEMQRRHDAWQESERDFWRYATPQQKEKRKEQDRAHERFLAIFSFSLLFLFGAFWFTSWEGPSLWVSYDKKTPLITVAAIIITFMAAGAFYYLREKNRRWYFYPLIELCVSAGLAGAAVQQKEVVLSIVALLGAVRVGVDGINRLITFWKEAHLPAMSSLPLTETDPTRAM